MRPLSGCRVLLTRPAEQARDTASALEAAGAEVVVMPLIRIEPPDDPEPLRQAARRLWAGAFDWAVVTSPNGAAALVEALEAAARGYRGICASGAEGAIPRRRSLPVRLCAVGPGTRAVLENAGLRVACVPERHEGSAIPEALERIEPLAGRRVLVALGDRADERLEQELGRRGARVERVTAYCTRDDPEAARRAGELVAGGGVDLVVVASPSQVGALARALGAVSVLAAAIGPTTARAAARLGWRVTEAPAPTPQGLVEACVRAWQALGTARAAEPARPRPEPLPGKEP